MSAGHRVPLWIPLPFLLLSAGCYCLVAEVDVLTCDRGTGTCALTQAKPLGTTTRSFAVGDLKGADLGSGRNPASTARSSKGTGVLLLTAEGTLPFMGYTTEIARAEMEEQVAAIRRFLASPAARRLEIRRDNRFGSLLIAAIPFAFSAAFVLGLRRLETKLGTAAGKEGTPDESATEAIRPS